MTAILNIRPAFEPRLGYRLRPGRIVALWATVVLHAVVLGTLWLAAPDAGLPELKPRPVEVVDYTPVEIVPPPVPPKPPEPQELIRPEPTPTTRTAPPPPVLPFEPSAPTEAIPGPGPVVLDPLTPVSTTAVIAIDPVPAAPSSLDLREGIDYRCRPLSYPERAVRANMEGRVGLSLRINRSGTLVAAEVARSSGHKVLDNAAMRWVRSCSFTPPSLDGGSTEAVARMPVQFTLR